jgi:signal transduction histidine kinase
MLSNQQLLEILKQRFDEAENWKIQLQKESEELKIVNQKLTESEALKGHFISNVTNEIINPFASILGLSKSIIASDDHEIKKIKNMAELIHSEAFDLDFQLKNIFTAARIEAGEIQPEFIKTDIELLISSIISQYRYKAEQKQLIIKFTTDIEKKIREGSYFVTDPEKIRLIISNLLSNSIKYSNAANRVEVKAWIEEKSIKISVKDYGIGIEKSDLAVIFDRFKRLNTAINSLNPGHGLGLSVTKALLDSMNGEIEIVSKRNIGSMFTISIPEGIASEDGFALDGNEFIFNDTEDEVF